MNIGRRREKFTSHAFGSDTVTGKIAGPQSTRNTVTRGTETLASAGCKYQEYLTMWGMGEFTVLITDRIWWVFIESGIPIYL